MTRARDLPRIRAETPKVGSEGSLRSLGAAAGVLGPLLLVAYFIAPALTNWPYAGAKP